MLRNLGEKYSPLYFLSALGLGGMATFFFMIFMFLTPHPDTAIPTFESIMATWARSGSLMKLVIVIGYVGLATFVVLHLRMMLWNLSEFKQYRATEAYQQLRKSNAGVTLMAVPLTVAMTVNALFVVGATMVPGMWNFIEYLLPPAVAVFAGIGVYALKIYSDFVRHMFNGNFSYEANTGLNQLLAAFAFAMVGVGMAAGAAMSSTMATAALAFAGSVFFATASALVIVVMAPFGLYSMLRYGLAQVNSASLWLPIPIITILGITFMRNSHGTGFFEMSRTGEATDLTTMTAVIFTVAVAMQAIFLLFGHVMMSSNGYYRDYVLTKKHQSPAAFTLVCPGVAVGVLGTFGLHSGLVASGVIAKFSAAYWVLMGSIWAVQLATIVLIVILLKNQIYRGKADAPVAVTKDAQGERELVGAAN